MLAALGTVKSLDILDLGCGEGRFSRMLRARGANVFGLDYTPKLAVRARHREPLIPVGVADGTRIPLQADQFDRVITYLVLLDIERFDRAVAETFRVLRPGGLHLDAHILPFRTASDETWIRDEKGKKLYVPVETYSGERILKLEWAGIRIVNYHRSLSEYIRPFLQAGFVLKSFEEPVPPADIDPDPMDVRVPYGMVTVWQKPQ
ncbi:MAG: class I SAM-dependent methyltransferase, partial [Armatimonadota bacterium]